MKRTSAFLRRFAGSSRGGIIPMAAAGVPLVALLAIAGTELTSLSAETSRMQDTVDAVALEAANQLSFSPPDGVIARAEANARAQLADMEPRTTLAVRAEIVESGAGVRLQVDGTRLSFFGNMLPPGGFKTSAKATAVTMNTAPLCVVVLDGAEELKVTGGAQVDAGECLVHSNGDIKTSDGGRLRAYAIQAGGSAAGEGITPTAQVGAKVIADPFSQSTPVLPSGCLDRDQKFAKQVSATWAAGRHCGHVDVEGTSVRLAPGVHVFNGEVQLKLGSRLQGDNVLIVFEEGARFTFDAPDVRLDLKGVKTGQQSLHGFVLAAAPGRTGDIELSADHIERLEGVVYSPRTRLKIRNGGLTSTLGTLTTMGGGSRWTVILAKELDVSDGATMLVNSDYLSSDVPVPVGVGDKIGRSPRLLQ